MPKILGEEEAARAGGVDITSSGQGLWKQKRTHGASVYVLSDNVNQTEDDILATAGLPQKFDAFGTAPGNPLAFCVGGKAKEIATVKHPTNGALAILWLAEFDWSSDEADTSQGESDSEPEDRTPKTRWTGELEEDVLVRDAIDGRPVRTAAGERLIHTRPIPMPILEVRRYELWPFDPDIIMAYVSHTNLTPFYGAPSGCALMLPIDTEEEVIGEKKYNVCTYKIKFKIKEDEDGNMLEDGWLAMILHEGHKGWYEFGSNADPLQLKAPLVAVDKHGNPTTRNLDGDGFFLDDQDDSVEPVYLLFNQFPKAEFNNLALGPFS